MLVPPVDNVPLVDNIADTPRPYWAHGRSTVYPHVVRSTLPEHVSAILEKLGYSGAAGLVTTAETASSSASRDYIWHDLKAKVGLDAAFFCDGVPLVGFTGAAVGTNLGELRKRLWNYGRVPLLVAASPSGNSTTTYNALSNPCDKNVKNPGRLAHHNSGDLAPEILENFSRHQVETGRFATKYTRSFRQSKRVDMALLKNLRHLRQTTPNLSGSRIVALNALIGGALIATYLAHREVLNQDHLFELAGVPDLDSALRGGRLTSQQLFRGLASKFNGDVFDIIAESIGEVEDADLVSVAALLRGDDLATGQLSLWPYDFSVVPPDLVSSVYEQLLENKRISHGTYYTPRLIVNLVLDEVLPLHEQSSPRVIDLACGSGAFITEAFRRLVYRARREHSELSYSDLSNLLTTNIFGIDINDEAARVAAFGLYLTLLEEVEPPTIWESVVLPQLVGRNLIAKDAFSDHPLRTEKFDVVVSNPPWKSALTDKTASYVRRRKLPIGDNQVAQAFLWLAQDILIPGGRLGFVMPSKGMLHNRSNTNVTFRRAIFDQLNVRTVVDLSALRKGLFPTAVAPTAVIIADKPSEEDTSTHEILHIAPHVRPLMAAVDALVLTPEEIRTVSSTLAINRPDLWKVLLWGSHRDLKLLDKLRSNHLSLEQLAATSGWSIKQGYKEGGQPQLDASHLAGLPVIDATAVRPLRPVVEKNALFSRSTLHRPRSLNIYRGPKILISRTLPGNRLAAALVPFDAVFSSNVTSVSGRPQDLPALRIVTAILVSSIGQYWQFMTSASWGVERETVETNELRSMPIPLLSGVADGDLERLFEKARKVGVDAPLLQEIDDIIFDLYKLGGTERRRIEDGIRNGVERFAGTNYQLDVDEEVIQQYRTVVEQQLSDSFPDLKVGTRHFRRRSYVLVEVDFNMREAPQTENSDASAVDWPRFLSGLTGHAETTSVVAQPAGFFLDGDSAYIIKTTDRDRWSLDAALDDADRIFSTLAFGAARAG